MGKISLDITADASDLLNGTGEGIAGIKELAAQGKITKESLKKDFSDAGKSTKEFNTAIGETIKSLNDEGKVIQALIFKYGSASSASKALNNELKTLAVQGKQNTAEFKQLSNVAADLANKIKNVNTEIKNVSSDTRALDATAEGFNLMSGSVSTAIAFLGNYKKTTEGYLALQKDLSKITALNTLFQQAANSAQEQSSLRLGITTAAQKIYTLIVGESTGALKTFRLALAATGVGLAIFLLFELITNWEKFKNIIGSTSEELGKFNAEQQQRIEISKKANEEAGKEIAKLEILKQAITDQKLPREQRLLALKEYNKTAEDGNKIAVTEIDNIKLINEQIEKQIQFTLALATVKAAQNLLEEKVSERLQLELKQRTDLVKAQQAVADAQKRINEVSKNDETGSLAAQVEAQQTFAQVTGELNDLISKQSISAKQNEINTLLALIKEYQDKYKNVLLNIEDETEKTINRTFQKALPIIDKRILDENINQIVDAFGKASIGIPEQVKLLRALGFNDAAIFKALSEAADKLARDGSGIVKVPVEPFFVAPKELPNISVLGFKIPVNLDITQEEADKISEAITQIADDVFNTFNSAFSTAIQTQQKFIDSLDKRIAKQQEVVDKEQKLADQGHTNNLAREVAGLNKLNDAREKAIEKQKKIKNAQVALDTISQLSSLITAAAKIYESLASIPIVGVPLATATVAVMFGAFAATKIAGAALTAQQGFREGGYTGDGDPSEVSTAVGNRGYKYHKKEFVANERMTAEGRDFLEAWHKGDKQGMLYSVADLLKDTGVVLPDENLPAKLFSARETHDRITSDENNSELKLLRGELQEIKEELKDWKNKPLEQTTAVGNELHVRKGNKTTIIKRG